MKKTKIKFVPISLEENIDVIVWAYNEPMWHDVTIKLFPELEDIKTRSHEEVWYKIKEVVQKRYEENIKIIKGAIKTYADMWEKYNNRYFALLSSFFNVASPCDIVVAKVGVVPVFPRDLTEYSFVISPWLNEEDLINTCAHEVLHFFWFEKWKQLYPETPREHFDYPHIEWRYSEMVTDPILNNCPFSELFSFKERGYDEFYELYDDSELVMDKLRKMYEGPNNLDKTIKDGFDYIRKIL